jgi:hypothetical protein
MDIEARLGRLEDRAAIDELVVDYFLAADGDDLDGVGASFTQGATFSSSGAVNATGRDAIVEFIRTARAQMGLTVHTPHYARLRFRGDDAADGLVGAHLEMVYGGKALYGAVRYVDQYVRQGGKWLIAARDMRTIFIAGWPDVGDALASDLPVRWTGAPAYPSDFPRQG